MAAVVDGRTIAIPTLSSAGQERGVMQMYVFDRIRDVAHLQNAQMSYEPLPKAVVAWPQ
jgi:hypothetical protein